MNTALKNKMQSKANDFHIFCAHVKLLKVQFIFSIPLFF